MRTATDYRVAALEEVVSIFDLIRELAPSLSQEELVSMLNTERIAREFPSLRLALSRTLSRRLGRSGKVLRFKGGVP